MRKYRSHYSVFSQGVATIYADGLIRKFSFIGWSAHLWGCTLIRMTRGSEKEILPSEGGNCVFGETDEYILEKPKQPSTGKIY